MADVEIQLLEQEKLIEQLKAMIRERDDAFQQKEKELQDVSSKLSKLKLQAKAKVAKEAKEAKEGKGSKSGATKKEPKEIAGEKEKGTNEAEEDGTSRAKSLLLRKKLEDKDRVIKEKEEEIQMKEQHVLTKEKIIAEREEIIESLTKQLEDKTKTMEEYQKSRDSAGDSSEAEEQINQMYAQIVYKDKNLLDLNNKILEQERKMIDIQELVGEKNEVIRGRDKVIELLQATLKEKDQSVIDQAMLISRLTTKVEANDETMGHLMEQVQKAEHSLKHERERFDLRLTESQKYFEETLREQEESMAKLRKALQDKEAELLVSENDLRELLTRHERDIQNIMSKGEVNIQDQVVQMLEQKLKDTNEVLEGKIQVIEVLQKESSQKDRELNESREIQKSFKDRLQLTSEQMMLFQANIADLEAQWQEDKKKYETKISDIVEKYETELTEKEMKIQTLASSVSQLEAAYTQSSAQYNTLQDRYHSLLKPGGAVAIENKEPVEDNSATESDNQDQTAVMTELNIKIEKLQSLLKEKEKDSEEVDCLRQKLDSLTLILTDKEKEIAEIKEKYEVKEGESETLKQSAEVEARRDLVEEISVLKNQVAELEEEKGSLQLKLVDFDEVKALQGELESQVANLKQQVETLELEKASVDQSLALSCEERDELQKIVDDLQSDLETTREMLQQVQHEVKTEKDQIGQLQGEKVSLEVKAAEAEEQREVAEKDTAELQTLLDSLRNKMESEMQQPLLDIERERDELQQKVSSLEEEAANQTHINKELKEELNSATTQLREKETKLSELQTELDSVRDKLDTQVQKVQELSVLKEDQLEQICGLHQEVEILREETVKTQERLQQSTEEYQSNREQEKQILKQIHSDHEETCHLLENAQTELEEAKAVIVKLKTELIEKADQFSVANETILDLEEKYNKCHSCVQELNQQIDDLLSVFDVTDLTLEGAKDCVISLQSEHVVNRQDLLDLQGELAKLKREFELTETNHNEKVFEISKQKKMAEEEVERIKCSLSELNEVLANKDAETEKLNIDLEQLKRKIDDSVLENNQQKRELEFLKESQSSKFDESESRVQSLLFQVSDLEKLLSESKNKVQEQCKHIEKGNCDLERISNENDLYTREIGVLKNSCDEKDQTLEDLMQSCSKFQEDIEELKSECHDLEIQVCERDTKIQDLSHAVELLKTSLKEEEQKLEVFNCQKDIIESENHRLKENISQKDSATAKLHQKLNEESQRRLSEQEQISCLKTNNEETVQCLKSLELETENVKSELLAAQLELNRIKNLCSDKDIIVQELTEKNRYLDSHSTEASESLVTMQSSLNELAERLKTSEEALAAVQAENENLQKQVSGMQLECNLMHEQLYTLQANLSQVQAENETLQLDMHNLEKLALDCSSDVVSLLKHVCCLNSEIQEKLCCIIPQHVESSQTSFIASSIASDKDLQHANTECCEAGHEPLACKNYLMCMADNLQTVKAEIESLNLNNMKLISAMGDMSQSAKDMGTVLASLQSENYDLRASVQNTEFKLNGSLSEIEILKSSQSSLKDKVTKLNERIQETQTEESVHKLEYETELNSLKEQLALLTAEKHSLEESSQSLMVSEQTYIAENGNILLENQVLKCQICDLNDNLKIFEEKCQSLEAEVQAVKQNWIKIQASMRSIEESFEVVSKEKEILQNKYDFAKEKLDLMHDERDKYKMQVLRLTEELKKLSNPKVSHISTNEINTDTADHKLVDNSNFGTIACKSEPSTFQQENIDFQIKIETLELELQEQKNACKDLEARYSEFLVQNKSLKEQIETSSEKNTELQMKLSALVHDRENVNEEMLKIKAENNSIKNSNLKMHEEMTQLQAKQMCMVDENSILKSELESSASELDKAVASNELLDEKIKHKESEYNQLYEEIELKERNFCELSLKVLVMEKELDDSHNKINSYLAVINTLKFNSKVDKQHLLELRNVVNQAKEENTVQRKLVEELKSDKLLLESNYKTLCKEKDDIQHEVNTLEDKVIYEIKVKENINNELEQQKLELLKSNENLKQHKEAAAVLQSKLVSAESKLYTLECENASNTVQIKELIEKKENNEKMLDELHESLVFSKSLVKSKEKDLLEYQSKFEELENSYMRKNEKCEALETELSYVNENLHYFSIQNDILQQDIIDLNLQISSLDTSLQRAAVLDKYLRTENSRLTTESESMKKENGEQENIILSMESQLEATKKKNEEAAVNMKTLESVIQEKNVLLLKLSEVLEVHSVDDDNVLTKTTQLIHQKAETEGKAIELEKVNKKYEGELKDLSVRLHNLEETKKKLIEEVDDLTGEIAEYKNRLITAESVIVDCEGKIQSLANDMSDLRCKNELLSKQVDSAEEQAKYMTDVMSENQIVMSKLKDNLQDKVMECQDLSSKLNVSVQNLQCRETEIKALEVASEKLLEEVIKLSSLLRPKNEVGNISVPVLETESQELDEKKDFEKLLETLFNQTEQIKVFSLKCFDLQETYSVAEKKYEILKSHISEMRDQSLHLLGQVTDYNKESDENASSPVSPFEHLEASKNVLEHIDECWIGELSKEFKMLQSGLQNLKASRETKDEEIRILHEQIRESGTQYEVTQTKIVDMQLLLNEKETEIANLANNVQELQTNLEKIKEERDLKVELLSDNVTDLVTQLDSCTHQRDELESELNDAVSNLENTEAARLDLENRLKSNEICLEEKSAALEVLQDQFSSLSDENDKLVKSLHERDSIILNKDSQLEELTLEKQELLLDKSKIDKAEQEQAVLISTLEEKLCKTEMELTSMQNKLELKEEEICKVEEELKNSSDKSDELSTEVSYLESSVEKYKEEILSLESGISDLNENVAHLKSVNKDLYSQLHYKDTQFDILCKEHDSLVCKLTSENAACSKLCLDIAALKRNVERFEERLDEASTKETELKMFVDTYSIQIEEMSADNSQLSENLLLEKQVAEKLKQSLENEKEAHKESKMAMEKVIEEHKDKNDLYETQISLLQNFVTKLQENLLSSHSKCNRLIIESGKQKEMNSCLTLEKDSISSKSERLEKQLLEQFQWVSELKKGSEKQVRVVAKEENSTDKIIQLQSLVHELREDQKIKLGLIESQKRDCALLKTQLQDAEVKSLALVVGLETEKDSLVAQLEELKNQYFDKITLLQNTEKPLEGAVTTEQESESSLRANLNISLLQFKELQDENETLKQDLLQTQDMIESLQAQISSLEASNESLTINISGVLEENSSIKCDKATLELVKAELEDKLEINRQDYEKSLSDLACSVNEVEKLSCQVKEADLRNKDLFHTSVELSQKIEEKDISMDKLVKCFNAASADLEECQKNCQKKDEEINILENSISNLREEYLSDKSVLSRLMIDMKGANQKFSTLIDTIVEKDNAMSVVESKLSTVSVSLEAAERKNFQLVQEYNEQMEQRNLENDTILHEKETVESCLNEKKCELERIHSELITVQETLKTTQENLDLCTQGKIAIHDALSSAKAETKFLYEEMECVRAQATELENVLKSKNSECINLQSSSQQSNTQIEYLLQSSKSMTETLERKKSEIESLQKDVESMTKSMSKYEALILDKNVQVFALVEELEGNKAMLLSEISSNSKLLLQKQNIEKMLLDAQTKLENCYVSKQKDDDSHKETVKSLLDENKSILVSLEQSKQVISDSQDKIKLIMLEKSALVARLNHVTEISLEDIKQKYKICRKDLLHLKQEYLSFMDKITYQISSAISEFICSNHTDVCSLQAEIRDQYEAINDHKSTITLLEKERDELLEQQSVRIAHYNTLSDKFKLLEEENKRLISEYGNYQAELTKATEALKHEAQVVQTLECAVQDTKCQLNQVLVEKESIQMKTNALENEKTLLSQEVERLCHFEADYSKLQESYEESLKNFSLQYQLISAELEAEKQNIVSLSSLNNCVEKNKQGPIATCEQATETAVVIDGHVYDMNAHNSKELDMQYTQSLGADNEENLDHIILKQTQQISLLEQELASLKEAQMSAIEWDDYDLRAICNKLEKEKQDLTAQVANQNKMMKKRDGQIRTLSRQLESLAQEQEQVDFKNKNPAVQQEAGLSVSEGTELDVSCETDPTSEIEADVVISSHSASLNVMFSPEAEILDNTNTASKDLEEQLRKVTLERDKFKADNKKLLKVGKGKDTKLNIMNKNFEKLRHERDELLAERDSLDNELQDLSSKTSYFDSSYDKEVINSLMMRCKELEAVQEEKQLDNVRVGQETSITHSGDRALPDVVMDKLSVSMPNVLEQGQNATELDEQSAQLKTENLKLQKVNKGKEAKIRKLEEKLSVQENEAKILREILDQKETDLSRVHDDRIAFDKLNEEKIILDFELQCAKEELAALRGRDNTEYSERKKSDVSSVAGKEDITDVFEVSELNSDIIRSKIVNVLQENKKLKLENGKLQKLSKGKEAKVKKVEDLISQQQKLISDKETDIFILKESIKDLTDKVNTLTEDEQDLRYRLENALLDRDEWYDHCQNLEDQLDAAHESIDIKNDELLRLDETVDADRETIDNLIYEKESLERDVVALQDELECLRNSLDQKTEQIKGYEAQLKVLQGEKEKFSSEIKKLQMVKKGKDAKAKKLEESVHVQENAMEAKEEFIATLQNRLQETEIQVHTLDLENKELKSQIQEQESDKQILQNKESKLENDLTELNTKLLGQNQQIRDLQEHILSQDLRFENQNAKTAEEIQLTKARENELEECLNVELMQKTELERKLQDMEQAIKQTNLALTDKNEFISDIEGRLASSNSTIHEKDILLLSTQETVSYLTLQVKERDKQLDILHTKITDYEKHVEVLENSAKQQKMENSSIQEQLIKLMSAYQESEESLQNKESELKSVNAKCEALQKQFDSNMSLIQDKDNEINKMRKKYLALDHETLLTQSLMEEKEKHWSSLSDEEILKLKKVIEEKEVTIDKYETDLKCLTLEKDTLLQKSEENIKDYDRIQKEMLSEKNTLEQNLSWYIQYYETASVNIVTLEEEKNKLLAEVNDLSSKLMEKSDQLQKAQESKQNIVQEKELLLDELQIQYNQAVEKVNTYERDLTEKNGLEISLRNELESLSCQYQQLSLETGKELSEKVETISLLQSELQESLNKAKKDLLEKDEIVSNLHSELQRNLSEAEKEVSEKIEIISKLESDLQENLIGTRKELSEKDVIISELQSELQKRLNHAGKDLSEKEEIISKLQSDLQESMNKSNVAACREAAMQDIDNLPIKEQIVKEGAQSSDFNIMPLVSNQDTGLINKDISNSNDFQAEMSKLKKLCKAKDAKIKKIEERLKTLSLEETDRSANACSESGQSETTSLKLHLQQVELLLMETQTERENLLTDVDRLTSQLQQVESLLKVAEQEKENLLIDAGNLSQQIMSQQKEIEKQALDKREVVVLEESLKHQIASLQNQNDNLGDNLETCNRARNEIEFALVKIKAEYTDVQHQSKVSVEELNSKLTDAASQIAHLNQVILDLNMKLQSVLSEKEEYASLVSLKDDELKSVKDILRDKIEEIQDSEKKLSLVTQASQGLQSEKERFEDLLKSEREEIQSLYEQMNELVSEKLDLETIVQGKEQDLKAARETLQALANDREKLEIALSEKEELQLEVETLSRDLNTVRERLVQRDSEKEVLQNNLQQKENDILSFREQLQMYESEKGILSVKTKSMSEDLIISEEKVQVLSQELETKKEAASKLKDMCFEKDQLITSLKDTVGTVSDEIKSLKQQKEQVYEELVLYKNQYHQESKKCQSYEAKLTSLTNKCNQLEMNVTEKDNTLIGKAEEIGLLHRRITSLEESLKKSQQNDTNQSQEIIKEKLISLQTVALQGMEAERMVETAVITEQSQNVPDLASVESQIIRTEPPIQITALDSGAESRHTDQVDNEVLKSAEQQFDKEVCELRTKLSQKDEEIERLNAMIGLKTDSYNTLDRKLHEKDEKIAFLLENMQEMEERLSQLSSGDDMDSSQNEIQKKEVEIQHLTKIVEEKELKFAKALATAKKLKQQVNQVSSSLEQEKVEKQTLEQQLKLVTEEYTILQQQHTENMKVWEEKDQEKTEEVSLLKKTELQVTDLQSQLTSYVEFCQQLQGQVHSLTEHAHSSEVQVKQLQDQIKNLTSEKQAFEQILIEKEEYLKEDRAEIEGLQSSLKQQQTMLEEKEQMNAIIQRELEAAVETQHDNEKKNEDSSHMQEKLEHFQKKIDELETEQRELMNILESRDSEITEKQSIVEELEQQCNGYQTTIQLLQSELKTNIEQVQTLNKNNEDVKAENSIKEHELNELKSRVEELDIQLQSHLENADSSVKCIEEYELKLNQLSDENTSLHVQISQQKADFENSLSSKDSQIELISTETTLKEKQIQELETLVSQLNSEKEEWHQHNASLNKTVEEKEEKIRNQCSLIEEKDNQLKHLAADKDRLVEQTKELENSNITLKDTVLNLQKDKEVLNEGNAIFKVYEDRIGELQNEIRKNEEEIGALTVEKEQLLLGITHAESQVLTNESECEKARSENEELRNLSEKLESEVVSIKEDLTVSQENLNEKITQIETLSGQVESLEMQLTDLESWKQEKETNLSTVENDLISKVQALSLELTSAKSETDKCLLNENELKKEVELYKKHVNDLSQEKTKLVEDLHFSVAEIENLNTKIDSINVEKESLLQDLEDKKTNERLFNDRLTDLTGKIIEISERNTDLSSVVDRKEVENCDLTNELQSLKNVIDETEESLRKLYSEHELQKTEYRNLVTECENMKESLQSSIEANQVLQEELQVLKSKKASRAEQCSETDAKQTELSVEEHTPVIQPPLLGQSGNNQVTEEFQTETTQLLTSALTVEVSEAEQLRQELDDLKQTFLNLAEEHKDATQKLITSEAKSEKMLKKLRTFKDKNDSLQAEVNSLKEELSSAGSVISINKKQMDDLHNQIGSWQERHTNEEGNHHKSKVEIKALKSEIDNKNIQIKELQLQLTAHENEKKQNKANFDHEKGEFERKIQFLKSQNEELNEKNIALLEEAERFEKSLTLFENSKEEYHSKCSELETQISSLESQVDIYCNQISDLKEEKQLLSEKYSDSSVTQDELVRKQEAAQRQMADMKEQYQMLEKDNRNFQDLIEKMSATNSELKNDNVKQKMMIEKMKEDSKEMEGEKQNVKQLERSLNESEVEKQHLEEEMEDLRKDVLLLKKQNIEETRTLNNELMSLRSENESCKETINGLNWKIDELNEAKVEIENLQKSSDTLTKDKKDLENEIEKLKSELSELDSENKKLEEALHSVNVKDAGIEQELKAQKESLQELESVKKKLNNLSSECEQIKSEKASLLSLAEQEKLSAISLKKQLEKVNKKIQAFDMLKDEYEFINNEYQKLLTDNSDLSKQVEELHSKLKTLTTANGDNGVNQVQKEHLDRERSNLIKRVEHLENQCQELRTKNSELTETEVKLLHNLQAVEFERDRLRAKEESSSHHAEDKLGLFQGDYDRLQQQFTVIMQQKNKIQADLNMAQRSLNQREARCQQLAMQVSQLAEDRSYLNIQLAALSKALREKEQEAAVVAQQYRTLYQAYVTLKATIVELERQTVTDMMYGTSTTTPTASTPTVSTPTTSRGHSPAIGSAKRLDSTESVPRKLSSQELEQVFKLTKQEQMLHEQDMSAYRLGHEEKEDSSKVKVRPVLTRRGRGYLDRLQRLMSLQRSVPPVAEPE